MASGTPVLHYGGRYGIYRVLPEEPTGVPRPKTEEPSHLRGWPRASKLSARMKLRAFSAAFLLFALLAGFAACGGYADLPKYKPFHRVSLKAGQQKRFNGGSVAAGTIIHCLGVGSVKVPPRGTHVIVRGIWVNNDERGAVSSSCSF